MSESNSELVGVVLDTAQLQIRMIGRHKSNATCFSDEEINGVEEVEDLETGTF